MKLPVGSASRVEVVPVLNIQGATLPAALPGAPALDRRHLTSPTTVTTCSAPAARWRTEVQTGTRRVVSPFALPRGESPARSRPV